MCRTTSVMRSASTRSAMSVRCLSWPWSLRAPTPSSPPDKFAPPERMKARPDIRPGLHYVEGQYALARPAAQRERHHRGLKLHLEAHLALALAAISEMNRQLDDLQAVVDGPVVHLDLEAIAVAAHTLHVDGLERRAAPQLEPGRHVPNAQVEQHADV